MATIAEILAFAPTEAEAEFLVLCDEGMHAGACEWLRGELETELESNLDYASLRKRAMVEEGVALPADSPAPEITDDEEVEATRIAQEALGMLRECWYCGETLLRERPSCIKCGRPQNGGGS